MHYLTSIILLSTPLLVNAEEFKLTDGRTVDLRSDGTYSFVESVDQILITASGCKNHLTITEDKDDFKNVTGYKYFTGFSIKYRISNETDFPLVVRQLATELSRDYGIFYTLLKTPTFADPIEPGKSLILERNPHLYYTKSEIKLSESEVSELTELYGCSKTNLSEQLIYIDTGKTKMKFPPNAGNIDPLDIMSAKSDIDGLSLEIR